MSTTSETMVLTLPSAGSSLTTNGRQVLIESTTSTHGLIVGKGAVELKPCLGVDSENGGYRYFEGLLTAYGINRWGLDSGYRDLERLNTPDAKYHKGLCSIRMHSEKNASLAAKDFKTAGELGSLEGFVEYAKCMRSGYGIEKDERTAANLFAYAIGQFNNPYALTEYAALLLLSDFVAKKNRNDAIADGIAYLRKAVEQRVAKAEYLLGHCYLHGIGVAKDTAAAIDLFQRACLDGEERATKLLGPKPKDLDNQKGIQWLNKAQENRDWRAEFEIALYFYSKGDWRQAALRFEKIIRHYKNHPEKASQNFTQKELDQFHQNVVKSWELLGICYQKGWGQDTAAEPNGLLPFYFKMKSEDLAVVLLRESKLVFETDQDRILNTRGNHAPLGENYKKLLKQLTGSNPVVVEGSYKERFCKPTENLVLVCKGGDKLSIDTTRLECKNLYIVFMNSQTQLIIPEYSFVKVLGDMVLLGQGSNKANLENSVIDVARTFVPLGFSNISLSHTTTGSFSANLALWFTQLSTSGAKTRVKNSITSSDVTPLQMREYVQEIARIVDCHLNLKLSSEAASLAAAQTVSHEPSIAFSTSSQQLSAAEIKGAYERTQAHLEVIDEVEKKVQADAIPVPDANPRKDVQSSATGVPILHQQEMHNVQSSSITFELNASIRLPILHQQGMHNMQPSSITFELNSGSTDDASDREVASIMSGLTPAEIALNLPTAEEIKAFHANTREKKIPKP